MKKTVFYNHIYNLYRYMKYKLLKSTFFFKSTSFKISDFLVEYLIFKIMYTITLKKWLIIVFIKIVPQYIRHRGTKTGQIASRFNNVEIKGHECEKRNDPVKKRDACGLTHRSKPLISLKFQSPSPLYVFRFSSSKYYSWHNVCIIIYFNILRRRNR